MSDRFINWLFDTLISVDCSSIKNCSVVLASCC